MDATVDLLGTIAAPSLSKGDAMFWRRLLGFDTQTLAEKRAALNGVSLFFGALIGANLGMTTDLPLRDYALIIAVVCTIVLYLYLAPVARRRFSAMATLLALVGSLYLLLIHEIGETVFEGIRPSPHIFVTICFWVASILIVELRPVEKETSASH